MKYRSGETPQVGDRVILVENDGMAAPKGVSATVVPFRTKYEERCIQIMWDRDIDHAQKDGGYEPGRFKLSLHSSAATISDMPIFSIKKSEPKDTKHSCTCSIQIIMAHGCQCGGS
jgi:hypothetical protein